MTQYLRWRGMQPIGRINQTIKKAGEKKALIQSEISAYIDISRELNRQGININQLTAAINSDKLEGKSINHHLDKIDKIRKINKEILESVQHLKASYDR